LDAVDIIGPSREQPAPSVASEGGLDVGELAAQRGVLRFEELVGHVGPLEHREAEGGAEAPQRKRRWPRRRQPVSSMLTCGARRTAASRCACGVSSASPARCRIASTLPVEMRAENSCSPHSTTSRRETRLRADSVTIAACNLGPNALAATSAGSTPVSREPQSGQRTR
jgi:hypothetical protein